MFGVISAGEAWVHKKDGRWRGLGIDSHRGLIARLGYETDAYVIDNYPRLIAALNAGDVDVLGVWNLNNEGFPKSINATCSALPTSAEDYGLYTLVDRPIQVSVNADIIKSYRIASLRVLSIHHLGEFQSSQHFEFNDFTQMDRVLRAGRVDMVLATPVLARLFYAQFRSDLVQVRKLGHYSVHLCYSHASLGLKVAKKLASQTDYLLGLRIKERASSE